MYRKIIVPLDGSHLAESALAQIPHLVGSETEVILLRVYEPPAVGSAVAFPPYGSSGGSPLPIATPVQVSPLEGEASQVREHMRREAEEYLDGKAEDLMGKVVHRRTLVLEDANAGEAISLTARDEEADLIVMSTHGRSGAVRWILGSVADKVLHSTHIPLLLVRPGPPTE